MIPFLMNPRLADEREQEARYVDRLARALLSGWAKSRKVTAKIEKGEIVVEIRFVAPDLKAWEKVGDG